ncbi:unnamed protein product [Rhizoctonia solani]|uniref:Uncharacterized protein n=1 Tax=Rhizoctonia solani TaxID=456999 RepID=A0A8H3D7M4_9AGAM|nr:unnamed protein product [Rhizoctonia solani]
MSEPDRNHANEFEQEIGRATRARTRLIVEGFSNLALIATFFAGVQAQLISMTSSGREKSAYGPIAMATNAAFFGGLIFSVFTAVLATLSARWFSILREDDADFLSSRWLSQDSKHEDPALLENYLDHQIRSLERIERGECRSLPNSRPVSQYIEKQSDKGFDPVLFDAECILRLLKKERGYPNHRNDIEQQTQVGDLARMSGAESATTKPEMPKSTYREWVLSYVLLSPLVACLPSFGLFTTGILLLTWDTQPVPVAIFTSVTVFICVVPLFGFFVKHRHKHVINYINLGRPSL